MLSYRSTYTASLSRGTNPQPFFLKKKEILHCSCQQWCELVIPYREVMSSDHPARKDTHCRHFLMFVSVRQYILVDNFMSDYAVMQVSQIYFNDSNLDVIKNTLADCRGRREMHHVHCLQKYSPLQYCI